MELKFLNKLEFAIFKHINPEHRAVTGNIFVNTLIGGAIVSLIVFVMQMCTTNDTAINIVAGIGLLALFGWAIMYSYDTLMAFSGWGWRILYGAYVLFLSSIAFTIAMWLIMIALVGLFLYGIFKIFFSSNSKKPKARIVYEDGTEVEAREVGRGICGEIDYEDENGNIYTKP